MTTYDKQLLDDPDMVLPVFENSILQIPLSILNHYGETDAVNALQLDIGDSLAESSQVIFMLIDGLGHNATNAFESVTLFDQIRNTSLYTKISTVFPSSTAPATVAAQSGMLPVEHELLEWNIYDHCSHSVISTLPYTSVDASKELERNESVLFNGATLFEQLHPMSVLSYYFTPEAYSDSFFSGIISKGATLVPYGDRHDLQVKITDLLASHAGERVFYYVYWDEFDKAEHEAGPLSMEAERALQEVSDGFLTSFITQLPPHLSDQVSLIVSADHGQVPINPEQTIYLNELDHYLLDAYTIDEVTQTFIPPTGGTRDVFLSVKNDRVDEIAKRLSDDLKDVARVYVLTPEVKRLLFGTAEMSQSFLARLGNILILPTDYHTVWYRYDVNRYLSLKGDHGGLSEGEMYVPLILGTISALSAALQRSN